MTSPESVYSIEGVDTIESMFDQLSLIDVQSVVEPIVRPYSREVTGMMKTAAKEKSSAAGYNLASHIAKGVKAHVWDNKLGFTVSMEPREWMFIFNDGTYKQGKNKNGWNRLTKPRPIKKFGGASAPLNRGAINALNFAYDVQRDIKPVERRMQEVILEALKNRVEEVMS